MEGPHKYHPPHRRYTQCLPSELPGDASQSSHNANHFCTSILSLDPAKEDGANSTNVSDALQHTKQNMETIPCKLPAVVMSVADVGAGSRRCRESAISFSEETHHTPNHNSNNNNKHSSIPMDSTLLTDSVEYDVHFISPNATNNNSTMNTNNNNMNNNNNNYKPRQLGVARHPADISTTSRYGNPSRFLSTANISSSMNANSNSIPVAGDSSSHLHGDCTPEKPTSFHIKDVLHVHRGEEGFTGGEMQQWLHGGENGQKKPFTLRVPLYALTTLILVVMVAIIGSLSIVPLDHVAGKSIDRVSVLLSGSLGNSVSDAIQSSLYYLPMSVKGFTTGWLVDSTTRTWPWTEDDMPQAMRQLCESIALSQSSHLLYLSISSPISGYGGLLLWAV
ncbi:hypothetical protein ADEAN_000306400 [Angomonas deanei]|uniref:Uncharacterized protein n=1 Tax=Angomonas deanei TaxID=59799 RepID=A0A7G2C7Q2_9TRYP|nr:hypothetical protein ADEAN_000306400 [Angomonas deanei]